MPYIVIRPFSDKTDGRFYPLGAEYPAEGAKASKSRINSLLNGDNANGKVYIRENVDEADGKQADKGKDKEPEGNSADGKNENPEGENENEE